jgi:hypothetical protein
MLGARQRVAQLVRDRTPRVRSRNPTCAEGAASTQFRSSLPVPRSVPRVVRLR